MALVKIEFGVVNETGAANAAKRVRQELLNLKDGATATSGTLTDRLGAAFQRLERREPLLVMRQIRGAVDELALSAVGAAGPFGRLAFSLASLGGGPILLGAIGGFAALALEVKTLVGFTDALEKSLFKANQQLAQVVGGGASRAFAALAASQRAEEPERPNIFLRAFAAIGSRAGLGEGDLAEALAVGQASKIATATQEAARFWELFHRGQEEARQREEEHQHDQQVAIINQAAAVQRLRLGPNASPLDISQIGEDLALIRLGFQNLDEPTKTRIADLIREAGALERLNITRELIPDIQINLAALAETLATIQVIDPTAVKGWNNSILLNQEIAKTAATAEYDLATAKSVSGKAALEAAHAHLRAAQIITAAAGVIAGLIGGGGAGGFLAGIGGIVGLISGGQIIGAAIGGLGTILLASDSNEERRHEELLKALEPVGEVLFLVAQSTTDPDALDSLVRRIEAASGRRISVRFGGR